ncbi:MAG TPA: plastocyanin/azurin family copper-binding protein [Gemmatimonadaceae bacterium]|nr:plastocyanin/azurin family copper-binding protein [Gemmatimonadaceae bacterium]
MRNRALLVGLALVCAAACSKGTTAPTTNGTGNGNSNNNNTGDTTATAPPPNTVDANTNNTFNPSPLTVTVGTTVSFVFGAVGHNVTFANTTGRPADIGGSNSNTTITRQFNTAGTFNYQCTIHAGMTGTVIVQ